MVPAELIFITGRLRMLVALSITSSITRRGKIVKIGPANWLLEPSP